jgi:hypothetical protein
MQLVLRALIILQTLAVELAALAAMGEVETTEVSGPMLSGMGLVIAYLSFRRNRPCGLCFGLAAPTAYVLCFSLVCGRGWSVDDARMPMFFIAAVIAVLHVGAAFLALEESAVVREDDRPKLPFQFSILSLLALILLVSVFFGSYQSCGPVGAAIAAMFVYGVILTYLLRQFHVMRVRCKEDDVGKGRPAYLRRRNDDDER